MKVLTNPKSVAVIGVSRDPHKIGYIVFDNLTSSFSGKIFGINPNADEVLGKKLYPTILDVSEDVDLAIICVPPSLVKKVLESCGKKGVSTSVIITAGFSELGKIGSQAEKELLSVARKFKMRLLGPNCLGVINNFKGMNASFATSVLPTKYRLGIFSQSGAMGAAMLDFANGNSFGFSYFVSLGNKIDISESDLLQSWAKDDNVQVAVGYLEDIKNGESFMKAARKFTTHKPLIILKGGMTKEGGEAARLHTAAMAQDEVVFKAAMKEAGVVLAKNMNDLFELAVSFIQNHLPTKNRLAIVSNAGGASVLAADACAQEGVALASLSAYTTSALSQKTEAASIENPIDLRGDATSSDYAVALDLCQKDPGVDGILLIATPQAMTEVESIAWEAVNFKNKGKKPIFTNFIGGQIVSRAKEICQEGGVSVFSFPERAVRSFSFQSRFARRKIEIKRPSKKHVSYKSARSIIHFSDGRLDFTKLAAILRLYGIPMAKTELVKSEKEAALALGVINPPLVMKISSPDILHKTDVGGVIFGVTTKDEAQEAYSKIIKNIKNNCPSAHIDGVTVMETAKEGLELIVGAKRDPVFGPVLMFGFGGIFVELISDYSVLVGPFTEEKILKLIESTSVSKIIGGYRSNIKYSKKNLIKAILGLGRLISEHPEIAEIEINPLILEDNGRGILGLDAKVVQTERDNL